MPLAKNAMHYHVAGFIGGYGPVAHRSVSDEFRVHRPAGIVPFVAPNGQNTMKKSLIALLAVCILLLVGAYVGVDYYTKRVDEQEQILLQQQQEAYALARTKRTGELRATLIDEELRSKLGIADQVDAELRITEQETKGGVLLGVVEFKKPADSAGGQETSTRRFRIEFNDDNTIQTCELTNP